MNKSLSIICLLLIVSYSMAQEKSSIQPTSLVLAGALKLNPISLPIVCDNLIAGGIYFDEALMEYCYCDGTSWKPMDGNGVCGQNNLKDYSLINTAITGPFINLELTNALKVLPSAIPDSCSQLLGGTMYYDQNLMKFCYCNGTDWIQFDGGGSCGCVDADADGYDTCDLSHPNDTDGQPKDCNDGNSSINPGTSELCDGIDNDCNGLIDEDFPTLGQFCLTGTGICLNGGYLVCSANGTSVECSAVALPPATEICNYIDDNCDGQVDEGFDLMADNNNCGACGNSCPSRPNATRICDTGQCGFICDSGYFDCDGLITNGCESEISTDSNNCGGCGNPCAEGFTCVNSQCEPDD